MKFGEPISAVKFNAGGNYISFFLFSLKLTIDLFGIKIKPTQRNQSWVGNKRINFFLTCPNTV